MQPVLISSLWLLFGLSLLRALWRGKLTDPAARNIWLLFFLWTIAFSLWGEASEMAFNRHFGGWPVAVYLKCACMLLTFYWYYRLLKPVRPDNRAYRYLDYLGPVTLGLGLVSFVVLGLTQPLPYERLRYLVIAAREGPMLVYAVLIFIPYTWQLWRQESHGAIRLKQGAALVCFICYVAAGSSGIAAGIITLLNRPGAPAIVQAFTPTVYVGVVAFMLALVPYRWLALPFYVQRWWLYRRLRRLETHITGEKMPCRLFGSDGLELAIYRSTIAIMDHYPLADAGLAGRIAALIAARPPYPLLVKRMAALRL